MKNNTIRVHTVEKIVSEILWSIESLMRLSKKPMVKERIRDCLRNCCETVFFFVLVFVYPRGEVCSDTEFSLLERFRLSSRSGRPSVH